MITFLLKLKNSSATFQSTLKRPPNNFNLTERARFTPLAPIPIAIRPTNRHIMMAALLQNIQGAARTSGSQMAHPVEQDLLDLASSTMSKSIPQSNPSSLLTSKIGLQALFHAQAMKILRTVHGKSQRRPSKRNF